jgi:hypothetical protein
MEKVSNLNRFSNSTQKNGKGIYVRYGV